MKESTRHNHKYPHFLIKNWKKKPWSKEFGMRTQYQRKRHMGEMNYYPEELENDLSKVENQISLIFKEIMNKTHKLTDESWAKIILYLQIQAIRMEGVCQFIKNGDSMFPGNNNFLFGVHTSNDKNEIIKSTKILVELFLNYDKEVVVNFIAALGIVVWESEDPIFVLTENAIFKEVDLDGKFLFMMMPISPYFSILVSKNSYFASKKNLDSYLSKYNDPYVASSCHDKHLINNFKHENFIHKPYWIGRSKKLTKYRVELKDVLIIIQSMIFDSVNLVFADFDDEKITELNNLGLYRGRTIINTLDDLS